MSVPRVQLVLNDYVQTTWLQPLVAAGLDGIQVRIRDESTRRLQEWLRSVRESLPAIELAINARLDLALAHDLSAVQLPTHGIPVAAARRIAPNIRIGCSVHSVEEARQAEADGADSVTFGHMFESASHRDHPPRGVGALTDIVRAVSIPVVAIGGIGPGRVADVRNTGAAGIAVIGAITTAKDPARIVAAMIEEWDTCD